MSRGALTALGLGQLVNWGVLYYAFAVLLAPVQAALSTASWVVTGAFSLALLVSAVLAPAVGRWSDRGRAPRVMLVGGLGAAALLTLWTMVPGVWTLYAVWAGLGACMSAVLYEPAFAVVTRSHPSPASRLQALALVTLYGGLASTVFLPLTAALVNWKGWRATVAMFAGLLIVSTIVTAGATHGAAGSNPSIVSRPSPSRPLPARGVAFLAVIFGASSLATASFIATLVPTLGERGLSPAVAASLGGLFGLLQLPGRALLVNRHVAISADALVIVSLSLQAAGLVIIAASSAAVTVGVGVMAFAAGSGLTTVARPLVAQSHFGVEHSGVVNGRLVQAQQLVRATGPIAASATAGESSHTYVLLLLAVMLGTVAGAATIRWRGRPAAST